MVRGSQSLQQSVWGELCSYFAKNLCMHGNVTVLIWKGFSKFQQYVMRHLHSPPA